ncbi:hypothetical protein [Fastidiosibacter lacustris]|uniref:hypothetical protein n=1 Tax=Fastidiosibacter lacustris TaxID=2056695 RepID=UPI000E35710A|nr:hypothetical protein [Fastidiosibacter lacustris]
MMYCIIANFGDDSIALIQKIYELKFKDVVVLSVDTAWQAQSWQARVEKASAWITSLGFSHHKLKAEHGFSKLVETRRQFPSQQFHWCAGFLKGITILNWLEEHDETLDAIILLANRRSMSKVQADLPDRVKESDRYDSRQVQYLLANVTEEQRDQLIAKTPFQTPLKHRSLECQPCIHFTKRDIMTLSDIDTARVIDLETRLKQTMFQQNFRNYLKNLEKNNNYYDEFAKTCSWDYGCGL